MTYVELIKEAAKYFDKTKGAFTRQDIKEYIKSHYPNFPVNVDSLNPQIQGVTVNALGGAPGAIGKNILERTDRGTYKLFKKYSFKKDTT